VACHAGSAVCAGRSAGGPGATLDEHTARARTSGGAWMTRPSTMTPARAARRWGRGPGQPGRRRARMGFSGMHSAPHTPARADCVPGSPTRARRRCSVPGPDASPSHHPCPSDSATACTPSATKRRSSALWQCALQRGAQSPRAAVCTRSTADHAGDRHRACGVHDARIAVHNVGKGRGPQRPATKASACTGIRNERLFILKPCWP